jgi:hypothetical protein
MMGVRGSPASRPYKSAARNLVADADDLPGEYAEMTPVPVPSRRRS